MGLTVFSLKRKYIDPDVITGAFTLRTVRKTVCKDTKLSNRREAFINKATILRVHEVADPQDPLHPAQPQGHQRPGGLHAKIVIHFNITLQLPPLSCKVA